MGRVSMSLADSERDDLESVLMARLGKASREARRALEAAIQDGYVSEAEWLAITQAYTQALTIALESTFVASALEASAAVGVPVDVAIINQRAADWARQYTYDLVRGIDSTNRTLLQSSIDDYFQQRMSINDLSERMSRAFGPARAENIAITETTRAASAGEQAYARELQDLGLQTRMRWETAADSLVCAICGPRNGTYEGEAWTYPPPAHPRCRCFTRAEVVLA